MPARRVKMEKHCEGLPAAANLEQSIILAQLQILRRLERATRAGFARTFLTGPEASTEMIASWSPAEE
jgi:hypothetical protein